MIDNNKKYSDRSSQHSAMRRYRDRSIYYSKRKTRYVRHLGVRSTTY